MEKEYYVENPSNMPDIHLHDNHFYYFPHMRLSGGGDILVENNKLEHARSALLAFDSEKEGADYRACATYGPFYK